MALSIFAIERPFYGTQSQKKWKVTHSDFAFFRSDDFRGADTISLFWSVTNARHLGPVSWALHLKFWTLGPSIFGQSTWFWTAELINHAIYTAGITIALVGGISEAGGKATQADLRPQEIQCRITNKINSK